MKYRAVCAWLDLEDGHRYQTGDAYPHDGRTVNGKRIEELISGQNKAKMTLIEGVKEKDGETIKDEPKPRRRAAKTAKNAE